MSYGYNAVSTDTRNGGGNAPHTAAIAMDGHGPSLGPTLSASAYSNPSGAYAYDGGGASAHAYTNANDEVSGKDLDAVGYDNLNEEGGDGAAEKGGGGGGGGGGPSSSSSYPYSIPAPSASLPAEDEALGYYDADFSWFGAGDTYAKRAAKALYPAAMAALGSMEWVGEKVVSTFGLDQSRFQYAVDEFDRQERRRLHKEQQILNARSEAYRQRGLREGMDDPDEDISDIPYAPPIV